MTNGIKATLAKLCGSMALRVRLVGGCKSVRIENKEGMEKWKNRKKK